MKTIVLTLIGEDRPGLVEQVAALVTGHGGNWVESRMAHLAGQFAGILRVQVADEVADDLGEVLRALGAAGLTVTVVGVEEAPEEKKRGVRTVALEVVGQDRPGIVAEVARVLSEKGVNVEELCTECASAPMSGEMLFRATATLSVPPGLALDELRETFEAVAEDLMVDVTLEENAGV